MKNLSKKEMQEIRGGFFDCGSWDGGDCIICNIDLGFIAFECVHCESIEYTDCE